MDTVTLLFWLLIGHAICDYPLQGEFLARGKNHRAPLPGYSWRVLLSAHAAIHAGAVALATQSVLLAAAEFTAHWLIDHAKCAGRIDFEADQALHVLCKFAWVGLCLAGVR